MSMYLAIIINITLQSFLMGVKRVWFSFQPPSHMLERESFHLTLLSGCKCGIYRGSMEHVRKEDLIDRRV